MEITTPFHIAIDSNHLRRDRTFSKSDILFLKTLAKHGLVKLHLPWFVYKECTSTCISEIQTELETVATTLKNMGKKGLNEIENAELIELSDLVSAFKSKVPDSVEMLWQNFITETDATLYKYDPRRKYSNI
jgi:hypothetical protein